ncbi:hypothetical protein MJO28_009734 [Puccinia striiformis f. sp. tritici]|uniref:phosphoserine transaminase n=4 Tax=Puccinia striiformis TaxID=27350 RepID=A0A0L0V801_9BASI|nr:hypothetical protein Pst134EA_017408 [Puccinia striiformis f. sp. tritici]KAI9607395.1 hypothetical protein H4Q26_005915 [Puccinia striiformis f. sp. tritici PST-130]KNE95408.1 hypothetical protein PSTG_11261 [Puccinia striiformis f. sp. tritici PST-78]POW04753.1 hypothetical protein PSHT_11091 [Puccinia striiformis]KAH9450812.1 hypothetical protein Pst134EB_018323 [Puccinia striiformis f. sp. tritici]KAH9461099.1 hypothetical protein Pst134EA_017408 [Puccinia striiformis f. sp. tritici]
MSPSSLRDRTINLGAGPCTLPTSILEVASQGLLDYEGTGMGLVELSHRSKDFQKLNTDTIDHLRTALAVPENFEILFMQGGGLTQFSSVVMNLVNQFRFKNKSDPSDQVLVDYHITGSWSLKASKEAARLGCQVNVVADGRNTSSDSKSFHSIPNPKDWKLSEKNDQPKSTPAFLYYCDNETVHGVEFPSAGFPIDQLPEAYQEKVPLVADMSSNILSRQIPPQLWKRLGIVFAGAQKNMAPSGLTVVIVRKDLIIDLDEAVPFGGFRVPDMLSYKNMADHQSLYNTPPMFSIYVCNLVLKDLISKGGVKTIEEINHRKSELVYQVIDNSKGFYINSIDRNARSRINIIFNCRGGSSIEDQFVLEAGSSYGIKQIKGHRSIGGIRVSLYNAVTLDQVKILCNFMKEFLSKHQE